MRRFRRTGESSRSVEDCKLHRQGYFNKYLFPRSDVAHGLWVINPPEECYEGRGDTKVQLSYSSTVGLMDCSRAASNRV
jgi:hypothetical protein